MWGEGEPYAVTDLATQEKLAGEAVDKVLGLIRGNVVPAIRMVRQPVTPGKELNGEHWTYSSQADLRDAQKFFGSKYVGVVFSHIPISKVDWGLSAYLQLVFPHEKEIVVTSPVRVETYVDLADWNNRLAYWKQRFKLTE